MTLQETVAPPDALDFIQQCPVGLAEVDSSGTLTLLNDFGAALLMPLAPDSNPRNFFDLLRAYTPQFVEMLETSRVYGEICRDHWLRIDFSENVSYLTFTVCRLDNARLIVVFKDITAIVESELQTRQAFQAKAVTATRADIAATVLHDIGNAISGIHTRSSKLLNEPPWPETENLSRLNDFIKAQGAQLAPVLGERKLAALSGLASELTTSLLKREISLRQNMNCLVRSGLHIEEILALQRHYVLNGSGGFSSQVSVAELLDTVLAIHGPGIEQRRIAVDLRLANHLPPLRLDRTRMIQALGNMVKNACESFDVAAAPAEGRRVEIAAVCGDAGRLVLTITDNGCGFPSEKAADLFKRGVSDKARGSGFGLANCLSTIESQGGSMEIQSEGEGKGAKVTIDLPIPRGE